MALKKKKLRKGIFYTILKRLKKTLKEIKTKESLE